jgi:hypothetical protein
MAGERRGFTILHGIAFLAMGFTLAGCKPARPNNVPKDSVRVSGADEHWWEWCSYDQKEDADHCEIFNGGGQVLWNEMFLPYDGGKAARETELMIDNETHLKSWQYVCLKNGRILIPKSGFENQKEFLDRRTGGQEPH